MIIYGVTNDFSRLSSTWLSQNITFTLPLEKKKSTTGKLLWPSLQVKFK